LVSFFFTYVNPELETKFKVQTRTFAIDFTVDSPTLFDGLKAVLKDLDVGILVNNVGIAYEHAEYFHLLDASKVQQIIQVNVKATTLMSYLVLPYMVEKKRGCIVNVGSISSLVSEPLYAVYSGSKGYINNFSEALHHEYKKYNISVQAQLPGLVVTFVLLL
jgi:17beta-estradiol 17-dehydrogenase / very-long-chain 3-oxoacyl-CoA reductase